MSQSHLWGFGVSAWKRTRGRVNHRTSITAWYNSSITCKHTIRTVCLQCFQHLFSVPKQRNPIMLMTCGRRFVSPDRRQTTAAITHNQSFTSSFETEWIRSADWYPVASELSASLFVFLFLTGSTSLAWDKGATHFRWLGPLLGYNSISCSAEHCDFLTSTIGLMQARVTPRLHQRREKKNTISWESSTDEFSE